MNSHYNQIVILRSQKTKTSILLALADPEMKSILDFAAYESKSINQIIKECNIAHTSAYRKVKWLVENNLIVTDSFVLTPDGKKSSLVRSVFKSITIKYTPVEMVVEIEQNIDVLEKTTRRMLSLD
jgi:predicted transcriptional regulator